ncbi:MAG: pyridoxal-dependent decarboxylase [Mogibacterium sp.]|nr:pyridoxal-dependent decarboxylase [Mogibacterium sp.]
MDVKRIETPYFLIKEELLEHNIESYRRALKELWSNSIIAYSVKTNSLPWILKWMNNHEVYAEVVSDEEYKLALLSGYSDDRIVFNGPIKTGKYLKKAFNGGAVLNIDSRFELDYIIKEKPSFNGPIGIRVNVNPNIFNPDDVGYQEDGFRFGFSEENGELSKALDSLKNASGNTRIGLHMHVNSITRSVNVYRAIAKYAADIIIKHSLQPAYIDIGGGFFGGVPGKATPLEYIGAIKRELEKAVSPENTQLIIEPGSAFIGSAMELHTSVLDVKDTSHGRIVTTDGSRIYIDPLWKKNNYLYTIETTGALFHRQVICGYTCMDHDRIMVIENKPELHVGDRIVYHRVGNYTVTFGGPFIRPNPPVYSMNEDEIKLVRKQMTVEEYYRMETV